MWQLLAVALVLLALWALTPSGRRLWGRLRPRRRAALVGRVVGKDGYIRPNILHGGGGYRVRVRAADSEFDLMVADYALYERLPEGPPLRLTVSGEGAERWLIAFRPD